MKKNKRRIIPRVGQFDAESLALYAQGIRANYPELAKVLQQKRDEWNTISEKRDFGFAQVQETMESAIKDPAGCLAHLPRQVSSVNEVAVSVSIQRLMEKNAEIDDELLKHVAQCTVVYQPVRRVNASPITPSATMVAVSMLAALLCQRLTLHNTIRTIFYVYATELSHLPMYELDAILDEVITSLIEVLATISTPDEVIAVIRQDHRATALPGFFAVKREEVSPEMIQRSGHETYEWDDLFLLRKIRTQSMRRPTSIIKWINALRDEAAARYAIHWLNDRHRKEFFKGFKRYLSRIDASAVRDEVSVLFCKQAAMHHRKVHDDLLRSFDLLVGESSKVRAINETLDFFEHFVDLELMLGHVLSKEVHERAILGAALLHACDRMAGNFLSVDSLNRLRSDKPALLN